MAMGHRAIASMVEKSASDRARPERTFGTLEDTGNTDAPGTAYNHKYWIELFKNFAAITLDIDKRTDKTPTLGDIIRFIECLPNHLQSRHSDGKISWSVIRRAVTEVRRALELEYPDWSINRNGRLQIDAVIQELLDTDQITKDPAREKQWITCVMIHKLATAVLSDAVQQGTKNWDLTLVGTFSIVFQAALASRSGEIARSKGYTGDEHMKWEDIELRATGDGSAFEMTVKLFYRKGHKRDKSNALTVKLGQLPDDNASVVDPVKLCLAYALRIGAVEENSWPELLDAVRSRPSKRVLWATPTSPVFCAITRFNQLDMSRPSVVQQNRRFLTQAAELVGMLNAPVPHDIRRGAASDVYSLKSSSSGDLNRVAHTLAHSVSAMAQGVTAEYIGLKSVALASTDRGVTNAYIRYGELDSWSERVVQAAKDTPAELPVDLGPAPYKKRRIQSKDIDTHCDSNGLDKKVNKDRQKAGTALQKQAKEQWIKFQRDMLDGLQQPAPTAKPLPPQVSGSRTRAPLQDLTNVSSTASSSGALTRKRPSEIDSRTDPEQDGVQEYIDPTVRMFANDVLGMQIGARVDSIGSTSSGASSIESMVEGCVSLLAASPTSTSDELAFLTAPRDQFIGYLSRVNLVRVSTKRTLEGDAVGNSRDPPSLFLLYCRKEHCSRSFTTVRERDEHEVNCRPVSALSAPFELEDLDRDADEPPPAPKTKRAYKKRKLGDALQPGYPKLCPESDTCGVTKPFNTRHTLAQHKANYHDTKWPQNTPCNFPGCTLPENSYFTSRNLFRRHLNRHHLQNSVQAQRYIDLIMPPSQDDPDSDG